VLPAYSIVVKVNNKSKNLITIPVPLDHKPINKKNNRYKNFLKYYLRVLDRDIVKNAINVVDNKNKRLVKKDEETINVDRKFKEFEEKINRNLEMNEKIEQKLNELLSTLSTNNPNPTH
jgi:hypothetical protein